MRAEELAEILGAGIVALDEDELLPREQARPDLVLRLALSAMADKALEISSRPGHRVGTGLL